jgi:5-methylcytosine-specific restriction enzyme subunit McrC
VNSKNHIQVYEHMLLRKNQFVDGVEFTPTHLKALQDYFGSGCPYFSLIHNGVKFNEFVGVLQVGELTIEVLPKTDKSEDNKTHWHGFLIDMLRKVGFLDVHETGYSSLRTKSNTILELYIELFLKEVKYLVQTGLIKKYRKEESNSFALKGRLLFQENIQKNMVHAERFYVSHTIYDHDHLLNQILYKTLLLVKKLNSSSMLFTDVQVLLLAFPKCNNIIISENLFDSICYTRKTERYRKAIGIAKMLLLNYHPDIRSGNNDVLALMFDMNKLWERYVFKIIKKQLADKCIVREQVGKSFWQPNGGRIANVYPDIVVYDLNGEKVITILDTKWKNISGSKPSDQDLKQMFVYNLYYGCVHSALLYPSVNNTSVKGNYVNTEHGSCSLLFVKLIANRGSFRLDIDTVGRWVEGV